MAFFTKLNQKSAAFYKIVEFMHKATKKIAAAEILHGHFLPQKSKKKGSAKKPNPLKKLKKL